MRNLIPHESLGDCFFKATQWYLKSDLGPCVVLSYKSAGSRDLELTGLYLLCTVIPCEMESSVPFPKPSSVSALSENQQPLQSHSVMQTSASLRSSLPLLKSFTVATLSGPARLIVPHPLLVKVPWLLKAAVTSHTPVFVQALSIWHTQHLALRHLPASPPL